MGFSITVAEQPEIGREETEMLVLTRKRAEKIQIGEDIVIKVIKTGRSTVKIGIEAPTGVRIMRAELCENTSRVPRKSNSIRSVRAAPSACTARINTRTPSDQQRGRPALGTSLAIKRFDD